MAIAIHVEHLGKQFVLGQAQANNMLREVLVDLVRSRGRIRERQERKTLWALRDISFDLEAGEVLGIVGRNGAGKSTLLKVLSRITRPTTGSIRVRGKVASLLEVGTGFHEELTGRENVYLSGTILGMPKKRIDAKLDEIVAFAEVERFLDTPIKRYSSGMRLRLGFAVAAHLESDILIVDEVLAVGDAAFQRKCLQAMSDFHTSGRTVLFVSHNLAAVQNLCSRAIWIESGQLRGDGRPVEIIKSYLASFATSSSSMSDLTQVQERTGSGDVRLTRIEFLTPDRAAPAVVRTGDSFVARLHFDARRELTQPEFGMEIHTTLGTLAAQVHTYNSGFEIASLPQGPGFIDVRIDDFNLMPGRYLLTLYVKNQGNLWHDQLPHCTALEVQPSNRYGLMRGLGKNPIVVLDCHWELGTGLRPARAALPGPPQLELEAESDPRARPAMVVPARRITVVVCTWNRAGLLRQTLEGMTALVIPPGVEWELLVVNNNSTDTTEDVIRSFQGRLPIRGLYEPTPGKSHALNRAVRFATGDYLLFTDDDVLVEPSWLAAYADAFDRWPDAAVFGGPILPWYEGTPPDWLVRAFHRIEYAYAALDLGPDPRLLGGDDVPFGANMAVRASVQRQYLYDPALGPRPGQQLRGEEVTLVKQMFGDGHTGWWVPGAKVRHYVPRERQSLRFVRRWYSGYGHYLALNADPGTGPSLFRRPLWLWRELVSSELEYRVRRIRQDPEEWIESLKAASIARGRFYHYAGNGGRPAGPPARV
jgi:lipopolysaccharide transport system ATP-binding protein